jgi:negative regulator of sigma E activity
MKLVGTSGCAKAVAAGALIALAGAGGYAAARSSARMSGAQLLRESAAADAHFDYRGTKRVAFRGGEQPRETTLRVIHLRPDRTRTEFTGPGRMQGAVRIQIGQQAWRFDPESGQWRPSRRRAPTALDLDRLLENYTASEIGTDSVADRRCYLVAIRPKRPGDPSRRVWIDSATYLPLKTQFIGAGGKLVSEASFVDIQFAVPKSVEIQPPKEVAEAQPQQEPLDFDVVNPSYLPPGYALVASTTLSVRGRPSGHLQYSDGLGTISLFEERQVPGREHARRGGVRGPRRHDRGEGPLLLTLRWEHGGLRFTLIGDISPVELRKMAESLPGGENARAPSRDRGNSD